MGDKIRDAVTSDSGADSGADRGADYDAGADRTVGHDTSGPTTDDAMTLSEERLNVGTQSREAGRARLRKYVDHRERHPDRPGAARGGAGRA